MVTPMLYSAMHEVNPNFKKLLFKKKLLVGPSELQSLCGLQISADFGTLEKRQLLEKVVLELG